MKRAAPHASARGFTLIEIMVVVAIMGLIMAMGVPGILSALKRQGLHKAILDLQDVFAQARGEAIMQNRTVAVVFHPLAKSFSVEGGGGGSIAGKVSSATLPEDVDFAMLDINMMDFGASDAAWVHFHPDGTCEEMTIVLHYKDEGRKMTLEFSTGIPMISDVDK
jgi:type II secretion system protein H